MTTVIGNQANPCSRKFHRSERQARCDYLFKLFWYNFTLVQPRPAWWWEMTVVKCCIRCRVSKHCQAWRICVVWFHASWVSQTTNCPTLCICGGSCCILNACTFLLQTKVSHWTRIIMILVAGFEIAVLTKEQVAGQWLLIHLELVLQFICVLFLYAFYL